MVDLNKVVCNAFFEQFEKVLEDKISDSVLVNIKPSDGVFKDLTRMLVKSLIHEEVFKQGDENQQLDLIASALHTVMNDWIYFINKIDIETAKENNNIENTISLAFFMGMVRSGLRVIVGSNKHPSDEEVVNFILNVYSSRLTAGFASFLQVLNLEGNNKLLSALKGGVKGFQGPIEDDFNIIKTEIFKIINKKTSEVGDRIY